MATPSTAPLAVKDSRPLRDRAFQTEMRKELLAWLSETGFECTMATLQNITGNNFRVIFQYLINLLDPNFVFDPKAKLEEEFIPVLKCVRYPFINQLDTKWLAAPASMHSWPALLGCLHWLVKQGKVRSTPHCIVLSSYRLFKNREDCTIWKRSIPHCKIRQRFRRSSTI